MPGLSTLLAGRFQRDVLWNFGSIAVLAVSGFVLQFSIENHYDAATLGVFNQVLAFYTIASQIAVGGINLSALKEIAVRPHDREHVTSIVASSLLPAIVLSALATFAYWLSRDAVGRLLDSDGVAVGIAASAPGLFFFAINKVLLAVVNGVQRMRAFALFTALRYFLILVALFAAIVREMPGAELAYVFSVSECCLFVALCVDVGRLVQPSLPAGWTRWIRVHLVYGAQSVLSGIMLELNAKIDVWMIGIYMSDRDVGIYSFAAMVAEGVNQLLVVLQNVYNPLIARYIAARDWDALRAMVRKGRRWTYVFMGIACGLAVIVYPFAMQLFTRKPDALLAHVPFAILMAGIVLASGWIPFGQTLLMAGKPAWHTLLMALTAFVNLLGNWLLIQSFGLRGSAAATGIALVVSVFFLKVLVRTRVGVRL
jgi:O-antigen/teichoic acid export membrane protein